MIPKIIYQAWIGEVDPPPAIAAYMKTVVDRHPDWEYILIKNGDLDDIYKELPDNAKRIYDFHMERKEWGLVLDPIRWYLPYKTGGIFMDTDIKIYPGKSFNELPLEKNLIFVNSFSSTIRFHTCWLAACKGNEFMKHLVNHMGEQVYEIPRRDVYNCTFMLTEYLLRFYPEKRERLASGVWSIDAAVLPSFEDEEILNPYVLTMPTFTNFTISRHTPMSSHTKNKHKYVK